MIEEKKNEKDEAVESAFNGALQTLERFNDLLKITSYYSVNENIVAHIQNLLEIFKESQGFLTKGEFLRGLRMWGGYLYEEFGDKKRVLSRKGILDYIISFDEDAEVYSYDSELIYKVQIFDFWIRRRLHSHNITMAKKKDWEKGFGTVMKRYGLNA